MNIPHLTAIPNEKGGVCKTTTAVNLATTLAREPYGRRVLLVDLDPQAQASLHLGCVHSGDTFSPLTMVMQFKKPIVENVMKTPWGVDVLASAIDIVGVRDSMQTLPAGVYTLRECLAQIPPDTYDHVIFDCPPSVCNLSRSALLAATNFVVPMVMQQAPLVGLASFMDTIEQVRKYQNENLRMVGVLGCNTPRGSRLSDEVRADVNEFFGADVVFPREIRYSEYLARGFKVMKPLHTFADHTNGIEDYMLAVDTMIERGAA